MPPSLPATPASPQARCLPKDNSSQVVHRWHCATDPMLADDVLRRSQARSHTKSVTVLEQKEDSLRDGLPPQAHNGGRQYTVL